MKKMLASMLILAATVAVAENIDPDGDGSKFAWSENLGWVNARPGGPGNSGVQVSDASLTGWMWSENAGWISLSCANTSCAVTAFGVTNDGCGALAGFAWSENLGWISFAPTTCPGDPTCGVKIDPASGVFTGRGWSENAGWITFSSSGPNPFRVKTAWRRSAPAGVGGLLATRGSGSDTLLAWTAVAGASAYDIVRGGLSALRSSGGNFQTSTQACVVHDTLGTSWTTSVVPAAGDGYWFLVRGANCGGRGSYDTGAASQVGSRDAEIMASGIGCP